MRVLVACEFSGIVRDAFRNAGHDAWSCDLLPTESPGNHIEGDVLEHLGENWDLMVAHPPCTYISYAGTRHWNNEGRLQKRLEALQFFADLWLAPIENICIENPRGCASPTIAKYSQLIHPYYFGDSFSKPTCLFLKNLPLLEHSKEHTLFEKATHSDKGEFYEYYSEANKKIKREAKWYFEARSGDHGHKRSKFFPGIARAMAEQWGCG